MASPKPRRSRTVPRLWATASPAASGSPFRTRTRASPMRRPGGLCPWERWGERGGGGGGGRGPQVMRGYLNRPEETAGVLRDGWLFTGDIARQDPDGFFFIVDRKKEMINVGGLKVFPREVEEVLYEHPAVREAAAIPAPDPMKGEVVKA